MTSRQRFDQLLAATTPPGDAELMAFFDSLDVFQTAEIHSRWKAATSTRVTGARPR